MKMVALRLAAFLPLVLMTAVLHTCGVITYTKQPISAMPRTLCQFSINFIMIVTCCGELPLNIPLGVSFCCTISDVISLLWWSCGNRTDKGQRSRAFRVMEGVKHRAYTLSKEQSSCYYDRRKLLTGKIEMNLLMLHSSEAKHWWFLLFCSLTSYWMGSLCTTASVRVRVLKNLKNAPPGDGEQPFKKNLCIRKQ